MSLLLTASRSANAQDEGKAPEKTVEATLATDRVVVFKDGFGLLVKTLTGTTDAEGRVFTASVPEGAVLGTFWASSVEPKASLSLRAEWVEAKTERATESPCVTMLELLRANVGKKVVLTRGQRIETGAGGTGAGVAADTVIGTLVEVLELPAEKSPRATAGVEPVSEPASTGATETVRDLSPRAGQLVVVETERGRLALPIASIETCVGEGLVTKMTRREEVTTRHKRLTFDLGTAHAHAKVQLRVLYFSEGIRWIPTYRVGGAFKDKAEIELQGEVLNEVEDLTNTTLDLVVGVPNFRFKSTISPLSLEQTLRSALVQAAPALMSQQYSNATFSQQVGPMRGRVEPSEGSLAVAPELAAAGTQDMFVYSVKSFSLAKKARATVPLFTATVPMKHLYTMDLKVARDARAGWVGRRGAREGDDAASPLQLADNPVWHQVELQNDTTTPWTTGAALILLGDLPLGQELLTYTPQSGRTLLPVTVAVDMCGSLQEEEIGRESNALHWNNSTFALIRKRVTVKIRNMKKEAATTRVSVALGGRAKLTSEDPGVQLRLNDFQLADWSGGYQLPVNNHSDVTWDLTLGAGEEKTLTFEIAFYVP